MSVLTKCLCNNSRIAASSAAGQHRGVVIEVNQESQRRTGMRKKRVSFGIAPDDLQVGDFVAVIQPKITRRPQIIVGRDADGDPMLLPIPTDDSQRVIPGVPHKVEGVSWPWAVFGILIPGGEVDGPVIHDLRKIKCMRLDDSYVDAIIGFKRPEGENPSEIPADEK